MPENILTRQPDRLLAIGDIHGCLQQLTALMEQVQPNLDDQVVFLGDYVDRGPSSAAVVEFLIDFGRTFPDTVFLRGNHEQMFLDYLAGKDPSPFLFNGGLNTLRSYEADRKWPIPEAHRVFFEQLQYSLSTEHHVFVHAGLRPGISLAEQEALDLLWIRKDFIDSEYDWGKTIVYGHTPLQEPFFGKHRIGLDTGCVYGRQLTCCDVKSGRIWQS